MNAATDGQPAWSPDGTRIAFWTNRDGNDEIYAMNANGTGPVNLSNNPFFDVDPAWSPDGTLIAFRSGRTGNDEVYVMTSGGAGQTNLRIGHSKPLPEALSRRRWPRGPGDPHPARPTPPATRP